MNPRPDPTALKSGKPVSPGVIAKGADLAPVVLDQKQLLKIAMDAINAKGIKTIYNTVHRIEDMPADAFTKHPIAGTAFEPIAIALNAHGIPTEMTLGGVMNSMYPGRPAEDHQDIAHYLVCNCNESSEKMLGVGVIDKLTHHGMTL